MKRTLLVVAAVLCAAFAADAHRAMTMRDAAFLHTSGPGGPSRPQPPGTPVFWVAADLDTGTDGVEDCALTNHGAAGAALDMSASTGACPIYHAVCDAGRINDKPCWSFDGSNDILTSATAPLYAQANTVCLVVNVGALGADEGIIDSTTSNRAIIYRTSNRFESYAGGAAIMAATGVVADTFHITCSVFIGNGSSYILDNGVETAGVVANGGFEGVTLGSGYTHTALYSGDVVEALIWNGVIDLATARDYLAAVYDATPQ